MSARLEELFDRMDRAKTEKLKKYAELVLDYNTKVNLTAVKDYNDFLIKHIYDCLEPFVFGGFKLSGKVVDVGTGGGFPLVPLAILFEEVQFLGIDSTNKKLVFIASAVKELGLKNVEVIHARAEELSRKPEYAKQFDFGLSRAVAELKTLLPYVAPFVKDNGELLLYKSVRLDEELINAEKMLIKYKLNVHSRYEYELPNEEGSRTLLSLSNKQKI